MNVWRALALPLLLCAASVAGITAMLVFDGVADIVAFALSALPLIVGAAVLVRHGKAKSQTLL
jgi:hypothetical protein